MKKMMKTLLCVLLILSCVPFALAEDDFTLRSGIVFGDTLEQIVSKETTLMQDADDPNTFKGKIAMMMQIAISCLIAMAACMTCAIRLMKPAPTGMQRKMSTKSFLTV